MIYGKTEELFLKWFKEEKQLTGFEDKPIEKQIFILCDWFKEQNYCISVKPKFLSDLYEYSISVNEGLLESSGFKSRIEAYTEAIELSTDEFNSRF